MLCFPNAKINIGLDVISKRPDGYHNLETVFYPVGLKDALEIIPSGGNEPYRFFASGTAIDGDGRDNLVIEALKLVSDEKEIPPVDIYLQKKIPVGAGLGGGSADAACMLKLLNDTFALQYSAGELERLAAKLGADCPFFIRNTPAFATGIGDKLEPVTLHLGSYCLLLVKPPFGVSTKDAYAMLQPRKPDVSLKEIVRRPLAEWRHCVKNDFEAPVFEKYPRIRTIKEQLYDLGAVYASLSGSGSAVYAFFEDEMDAGDAFDDCFVWRSGLSSGSEIYNHVQTNK